MRNQKTLAAFCCSAGIPAGVFEFVSVRSRKATSTAPAGGQRYNGADKDGKNDVLMAPSDATALWRFVGAG
jgi:hypothetical protein